MTDIKTRLADALREFHRGAEGVSVTDWTHEISDALLSLPGIAIVELPDTAGISSQHIRFGPGGDCEYDCCPPWVRDDDSDIDFGLDEVRRYAAALLSAANAAEQGTAGS